MRWAQFMLFGHAAIAVVSIVNAWYLVPVMLSGSIHEWVVVLPVQLHPACGHAPWQFQRRRRFRGCERLPTELQKFLLEQPYCAVLVLAHELSYRAPHVRRRAVLPPRRAARGHQARPATNTERTHCGLEGDYQRDQTADKRP